MVPVARKSDGSPLTGPVLERLIDIPAGSDDRRSRARHLTSGLTYQHPLTLDTSEGHVSRGAHRPNAPAVDRSQRRLGVRRLHREAVSRAAPIRRKMCVKGGFDPASEYVLVYTAKDPLVLGIGYRRHARPEFVLALRDRTIRHAQPARREDQVGDQPRRFAVRQFHPQLHSPGLQSGRSRAHRVGWRQSAHRRAAARAEFPLRGRRRLRGHVSARQRGRAVVERLSRQRARPPATAGLLDRCRATNTCPKIFETFGALEFWFLRESPDLVGTDAKADIPLPPNVRRYFFPGTTHGGGRGGFSTAAPTAAQRLRASGQSQSGKRHHARADRGFDRLGDQRNRAAAQPLSRASTRDNWRRPTGPRIGFPQYPRRAFARRPGEPGLRLRLRAGFQLQRRIRPDHQTAARDQADSARRWCRRWMRDGNDVAGVPSVLRQAPLGTYLGWNVYGGRIRQGQDLHLERRLSAVRARPRRNARLRAIRGPRSKSATAPTRLTWMR